MTFNYNKRLSDNAKSLRKNQTEEERALWYGFFKNLPINVHRQKVIGNYIVDFYCAKSKLVVELDGSQHYEEENTEYDKIRDNYLKSLGLTVLRFSNRDVNERFRNVCEEIYAYLDV